jgi:hypothetical protein
MSEKISIDPMSSALLMMDFQTVIVDSYAADKEAHSVIAALHY